MMAILITNIKGLVGVREHVQLLRGDALRTLPVVEDAYLLIEGEHIAEYGEMKKLRYKHEAFSHIEATGKFVLPAWCDSHTHLVFAGSREAEFVDKIRGCTYVEIAARGGGILQSARMVQQTSEDALFNQSYARLQEVIKTGTGAIEVKSGYGLSVEGELKMLRVIRRLKNASRIPIKATFLGAHALPHQYKDNRDAYTALIIEEMLPQIAKDGLADFIDVFCEAGFFSPEETERLCKAGMIYGLTPKIHANQLHASGGVETGVALQARSVDHLESMNDHSVAALATSSTVGTLLPTAAFFLRMQYPPARQLLNAGCAIALASDFNPGSSPSGNMNFVVALGCIQMKLLPEEAINAATINGAYAMDVHKETGSITLGKRANLILTKSLPSLHYLPYAFGESHVENVMVSGEWVF